MTQLWFNLKSSKLTFLMRVMAPLHGGSKTIVKWADDEDDMAKDVICASGAKETIKKQERSLQISSKIANTKHYKEPDRRLFQSFATMRCRRFLLVLAVAMTQLCAISSLASHDNPPKIVSTKGSSQQLPFQDSTRRNFFGLGLTSAFLFGTTIPQPAQAFPNKISNQYDDRPKRRGPQVSENKRFFKS